MKQSVLHTIRASMDGFSKGQKRIADYILNNYDKAAFMTAAKLGQTAQVSESTVVRFAAELGYSGYPAMQKALQEIIRGKLTSVQRIQASQDQMTGNDILAAVMQRDMDSIHTAIEQIDRKEFQRVVELLLNAQHIYILGVRSSSFLAGYLNFYFHLLFKNVIYVQNTAAGEIYEQMIHIGPGDVMVGISFPRYSKRTVKAIDYAMEHTGAEAFNLGTGHAVSVLELVNTFMEATGVNVPYVIGPRREGDLPQMWADTHKAETVLGWKAEKTVADMCRDSWNFVCSVKKQ